MMDESMASDKEIECSRYNRRAKDLLSARAHTVEDCDAPMLEHGAVAVPLELRAPYTYYEHLLAKYLVESRRALEICAGTGLHSGALLAQGTGSVVCTDISENSLQVLKSTHGYAGDRLSEQAADMECLPFEDQAFDVVACAGGLSYGDPQLVMREIRRVLRPGGHFVCVDSFNENPVYRLNRWLHYLRGERTKSTLLRMPGIPTIKAYKEHFGQVDVRYFGAIAWLSPILKRLVGSHTTARLMDRIDEALGVHRAAFKFVMVARRTA
jgi:ubiquinone/menaquinone biosynthesis C-methylase UbiE